MTAKLYRVKSVDAGHSHHFSQTGDHMRIAGLVTARRGSSLPAAAWPRRAAFTLIELLVVIAVIAVLVALLIPAVIQSRGAARRAQCANNLKQLASATQQFHNRMDALPVYWGAMKLRPGEMFGGWLAHILPELDQQVFYDRLLATGTQAGRTLYSWKETDIIEPARPPSPDWNPGTWQTTTENVTLASGAIIVVTRNVLVGRTGSPGNRERRKWRWEAAGPATFGIPNAFDQVQSTVSLGFLQCGDDPSSTPPGSMVPVTRRLTSGSQTFNWSLTNYQANAHVFTKFGLTGRRYRSGSEAGVFPPPAGLLFPGSDSRVPTYSRNATGSDPAVSLRAFTHSIATDRGPAPRSFGHVVDGLSNTIMFGEGMRQCDGGSSYRFALLPSGYSPHEHAFGIEPSFTGVNSTVMFNGSLNATASSGGGFPAGNTLRFQTRPSQATCNSFRVQANHGPYLMTVMCDGAVRAISSSVSAREQVTAEASGREHYGTRFYDATSRGGDLPDVGTTTNGFPNANADGVWDMLMVANDRPENVLSNTGEVGKEK
jgi:prepilin-type N-terminal cleavage/methylation domain-containing protein